MKKELTEKFEGWGTYLVFLYKLYTSYRERQWEVGGGDRFPHFLLELSVSKSVLVQYLSHEMDLAYVKVL
jgi:hypothetical protein